jgi:hypothetical protein
METVSGLLIYVASIVVGCGIILVVLRWLGALTGIAHEKDEKMHGVHPVWFILLAMAGIAVLVPILWWLMKHITP